MVAPLSRWERAAGVTRWRIEHLFNPSRVSRHVRLFPSRRWLAALVILLCVCQAVGGIGVVAGVDAGVGVASAQESPTATPTNNTTVQQEDPDEVSEDGDSGAVRSYLAKKLAERLGESSIQISQGQYEQGQSALGSQYNDLLEQYVDVEGGTGESSGTESFREASENQQEFANATQRYNETYQEYREAKQNGNTTRARELARELDRLEQQVNASGQNVTRSYETVENTTGADLTNASTTVNETTQSVGEQQQEVVTETFVRTNLSVSVNRSPASFTEPASVLGTITLENGSALANETVRVRVGERVSTVRTDASGSFSVTYQPIRAPTGEQTLSVAFLPADSSVYLGASSSVRLNVTATTAELSVVTDTSTVRFGDRFVVSGRAAVDGVVVPGAQVRVVVGGRTAGTVTTASDGTYRLATTLPATVPLGEADVTATVVPSDRAVRSESVTTTLEVQETETRLQLNTTALSADRIETAGRLETVDGTPVSGRPVELRVNGTTVATIDTGPDGRFERTVSLPASVSGVAVVQAQYDEPSSNLAASSARRQVALGGSDTAEDVLPSVPVELLVGGGGALVSLLGIGWLLRRDTDSGAAVPSSTGEPEPVLADTSEGGTDMHEAGSLLEEGETEAAVRALYGAVRQRLGTDTDRTATHWEFFASVAGRVDDETAGLVERLTEAYEQVVYSPADVDSGSVEELLREAERLDSREE